MGAWKAIGFTALGAGLVVGAEAWWGMSLLSKVQTSKNTAGGYTLRMIENPRTVGHVAAVGLFLTSNGQPVPFATVNLTIAQQSGTYTGTLITDKDGIGLFSVLAQHPQTMVITAAYKSAGGTTVTDKLNVNFAAQVASGG